MGNINIGYAFTISPNFCFKRVFIKDYEASKNTSIMRKSPLSVFTCLVNTLQNLLSSLTKYLKLPIILVR